MPARRFSGPLGLAAALLLATTGGIVLAQADDGVEQNSPFDSSGSYEIGGIQVDVTGKDANAARYAGWRLAQRKGWQLLSQRLGGGGGSLSDSTLDSMVSGIVVENEEIGPTATLLASASCSAAPVPARCSACRPSRLARRQCC